MERVVQTLLVTVTGTAYSIADCGEQLSWLCAALSWNFTTSSTPTNIRLGGFLGSPITATTAAVFRGNQRGWSQNIVFRIQTTRVQSTLRPIPLGLAGVLDSDCFSSPVVVGFPIRRRPEQCPNIEISPAILRRAIESSAGILILKGGFSGFPPAGVNLVLVGREPGVFFWRSAYGEVCSIGCCHCDDGLDVDSVNPTDLDTGRHFVCTCKRPTPQFKEQLMNITEDKAEDNTESSDAEAAITSASPLNDSLDPDMLSIPSGSDAVESCEDGGPVGVRVFRAVFGRLILHSMRAREGEYGPTDWKSPNQDGDDGGQRNEQRSNPTPTVSRSSLSKRQGKRKVGDNNEGNGDDREGDELPGAKKRRMPPSTSGPRCLACPFWKFDPTTHHQCPTHKIDTIAHLKQHLTRRHTPAHYCQRFYGQFPKESLLDAHINEGSCSRQPNASLEGVSYDQRRRLSMKSAAKGSERQHWLAIWIILFPEAASPTCIYVYSQQLVELRTIRQFALQNGPGIFLQELRARGMDLRPEVDDEQLQQALRSGLTIMFDRLLQGPPGEMDETEENPAESNFHEEAPPPSFSGQPPESITASGLGLGSSSNTSAQPSSSQGYFQHFGPQVAHNNSSSLSFSWPVLPRDPQLRDYGDAGPASQISGHDWDGRAEPSANDTFSSFGEFSGGGTSQDWGSQGDLVRLEYIFNAVAEENTEDDPVVHGRVF